MQELKVIEEKGQRVLTTEQIAKCYGSTTQLIKNNFNYNKERYREGKHYIALQGDELRAFKARFEIQTNLKFAHILYLWTEKGALLHAKSLNTDKAWEVYDYLVDFYFRAKEKLDKKEVVPVNVTEEPLKDEIFKRQNENYDAISIFKILLRIAEARGLVVKSKGLITNRSRIFGNRIAIQKGLSLEEVNYELAFELFHSVVNYDKGDIINTPLMKYYNSQAERAASLIIEILNTKTA